MKELEAYRRTTLFQVDETGHLFISPAIRGWEPIHESGINVVVDLEGDIDHGVPNDPEEADGRVVQRELREVPGRAVRRDWRFGARRRLANDLPPLRVVERCVLHLSQHRGDGEILDGAHFG